MHPTRTLRFAAIVLAAAGTSALAQVSSYRAVPLSQDDIIRGQIDGPGGQDGPGYDLNWFTMDGGGATYLTGGGYQLGATAGQPDAGFMAGGAYTLGGGFWYGAGAPNTCYANCDQSTGNPLLTANDFQCFINAFAANNPYANCDGSTGTPALTANDFQCFINAFAAGCT